MKLRIFNNSIRLRLRQSEVTQLIAVGSVEGRLDFGVGSALEYRLVADGDASGTRVAFVVGEIRITVPKDVAHGWANGSDVTISANQDNSAGGLQILIEKDFQCLHKDDPSEADAYPNPMLAPN